MGLGWLVNAYSTHNAKEIDNKAQKGHYLICKEVSSQDARRSIPGMQGDGFASQPSGIMEVAMWLCVPLLHGL